MKVTAIAQKPLPESSCQAKYSSFRKPERVVSVKDYKSFYKKITALKLFNFICIIKSNKENMILQKGTAAPGFKLSATPDQTLCLQDFKGKRLILVFYPADWSPVCSDQIGLYNETLKLFRNYHAEIIGISVDGKWCHFAFSKHRKIHFPLLADFEPKGEVSRAYGAYNEEEGQSLRALFVIDEEGIIDWSYLSPDGINPGADGILDALEKMENVQAK